MSYYIVRNWLLKAASSDDWHDLEGQVYRSRFLRTMEIIWGQLEYFLNSENKSCY